MIKALELQTQPKNTNHGKISDFPASDGQPHKASQKKSSKNILNVAVAGNPNTGKSTLINSIAGTRLHVGNWPGVTVEKKEAIFAYKGKTIKLVDLPGTYSLSPYTEDEVIARNHLIHEKPDVIINVIDSTNLERNLYLTVQLLELEIPIIAALNIYDETEKKGYKIDIKRLEALSGAIVVPTVAINKSGLDELRSAVIDVVEAPNYFNEHLNYGNDIESAAKTVEAALNETAPYLAKQYPSRWLAFKLFENDDRLIKDIENANNSFCKIEHIIKEQREICGEDIESIMAATRYGLATNISNEVLEMPKRMKIELTDRIDSLFLHKYLGIPIFFAVMWVMFKLTFDVSTPFVGMVETIINGPFIDIAVALLDVVNAPVWVYSLIIDGIIAGVGFVFSFVPIIFTMMFFITFLEGSGYMARAAFIMDRAMHSFGLHGKAFIPMLLGFGCNVPAIYATRVLENKSDRILTSLLIPLMSCGARLPVYTLIIAPLFAGNSGTILWSLYTLGIVIAVLIGIVFKKTLFRGGEQQTFIMELPPYRMPSFKNLMTHTWEKGKHFLTKAGTYIFAVSIIVWFLLSLPWGVESKRDSYLGKIGDTIAPVLQPLGFGNWEAASALVTGIIAKEIVIGTMGEIYIPNQGKEHTNNRSYSISKSLNVIGSSFIVSVKEAAINLFTTMGDKSISANQFFAKEDLEREDFRTILQKTFTPLSAYSFMVFVLLYSPCIVTAIAMKHEFGSWKWFGIAFGYEFALAWVAAFVIYQGGTLLGFGH